MEVQKLKTTKKVPQLKVKVTKREQNHKDKVKKGEITANEGRKMNETKVKREDQRITPFNPITKL